MTSGHILVLAQTSTGTISGTVSDQTGAIIPGAYVRIIDSSTATLVRAMQTNQMGRFSAPLIKPSLYSVEVEVRGFRKYLQSGIQLRVDQSLDLQIALEPGIVTEQVTVNAPAVQLDESTHTVGQVIDERTIQNLPLNGRNYLALGKLAAGTVPNVRSNDKTFSAYGTRGFQNAFLLDGARNVSYLRGLDNKQRDAMRPSLEAIAEFKVQTSNVSAEYGASAGAIVTVVTKSGTNEIHGSTFEFMRNNRLDARNFFAPPESSDPLFIQHQFGGSLGGPLVKNRVFWHGAYQRTHISQGTTQTATLPSREQKSGVFGSRPIYNPFTTHQNPSGSGYIRDPFPNNEIPPTAFDPIGKTVVDRYPDPMFTTAARNFVWSPLEGTRVHNATFRGDVRITDADSMFGRYSFISGNQHKFAALPEPAGMEARREEPAYSVGYGYTRAFGASAVNEFRFGWNHIAVDGDALMARDEIVPGSLAPDVPSGIPGFSLSGFTGIGGSPSGLTNLPTEKFSAVWNASDNLAVIHGNHVLKFGFDYQLLRTDTNATNDGRGGFSFNGVFSQDPQRRSSTGSPVADILLGLPNSLYAGTTATTRERQANYYWYIQDDWKVTRYLTLNFGLRYELTQPFVELDDEVANLILERDDPLFGQYVFAGEAGRSRSLLEKDLNNLAPRFGFAYRTPFPGCVIRGGYGIFYGQDEATGIARRLTFNPPFQGYGSLSLISDQLFPSSIIKLSEGLSVRPTPPDRKDFVFDPSSTAQIQSWSPRYTIPYLQQWNLSVQKSLPAELLWEITYVGSHGLHWWAAYEGNQPFPGPGSPNTRRPLAQITRASIRRSEPWGSSTYHGLSTRLEKRLSGGLSFLVGYTFGKSLDTTSNAGNSEFTGASNDDTGIQNSRDLGASKGASNHNIPHVFVFSGVYELPFGSGRTFKAIDSINHIIGGWNIGSIVTFTSGIPFTPQLSFDNANTGTTSRPDRIGDGEHDHPTIDRWFDINDFVFPPQYTFGNSGRNIIYGPGTNMVNFSAQRNFPIPVREGTRLEFRFEAFNFLNRPHFHLPGASIGTSSAGVISATSQDNRQLQFGLKLVF
jgi:hypothetical protein